MALTAESGAAPLLPEGTCGCGAFNADHRRHSESPSSLSSIAALAPWSHLQSPGDPSYHNHRVTGDPTGRIFTTRGCRAVAEHRSLDQDAADALGRGSWIPASSNVIGAGACSRFTHIWYDGETTFEQGIG